MGSWFSYPADSVTISKESYYELMEEMRAMHTHETDGVSPDADSVRDLAYRSLQHYNANNPGAEFRFPNQRTIYLIYPPTKDMRAACVCFRRDLWYHLNFSARPRTTPTDGQDQDDCSRTFFAEICYDNGCNRLIVKTCTILQKPPCFGIGSSCAVCPDESEILHPADDDDDAGFVCGKEGHEREFFREVSWDGHTREIFSQRDMLRTPFMLGGCMPRYILLD